MGVTPHIPPIHVNPTIHVHPPAPHVAPHVAPAGPRWYHPTWGKAKVVGGVLAGGTLLTAANQYSDTKTNIDEYCLPPLEDGQRFIYVPLLKSNDGKTFEANPTPLQDSRIDKLLITHKDKKINDEQLNTELGRIFDIDGNGFVRGQLLKADTISRIDYSYKNGDKEIRVSKLKPIDFVRHIQTRQQDQEQEAARQKAIYDAMPWYQKAANWINDRTFRPLANAGLQKAGEIRQDNTTRTNWLGIITDYLPIGGLALGGIATLVGALAGGVGAIPGLLIMVASGGYMLYQNSQKPDTTTTTTDGRTTTPVSSAAPVVEQNQTRVESKDASKKLGVKDAQVKLGGFPVINTDTLSALSAAPGATAATKPETAPGLSGGSTGFGTSA